MRISTIFDLRRSQHELDFVDLDISRDTRLYLEPYYLRRSPDSWCQEAARTIQDYTTVLLGHLKGKRYDTVREILSHLNEPNETSLGMSSAEPQGRGFAAGKVETLLNTIIKSAAVAKGLVNDLEDFRVLVPGIGPDMVSDMVTNIIRGHLIQYTQEQCDLHRIPLEPDQMTAPYWDDEDSRWTQARTDMLVVGDRQILFVPKSAVSRAKAYTRDRYHRQFVVPFLQGEHLRQNTKLVIEKRLKRGGVKRVVTKKDVIEHEGSDRIDYIIEFTERHPDVFKNFKATLPTRHVDPLPSGEIADTTGVAPRQRASVQEISRYLVAELQAIKPGRTDAHAFHNVVHAILEFVFYPRLNHPKKEQEIEQGDKRIDITFNNAATIGFFHQLHAVDQIPARFVFFECKNYQNDPRNPELDQLSGRFSPNSSKIGVLVCRQIVDMDELLRRCHNAWVADRGFILPLDEPDLVDMLNHRGAGHEMPGEDLLYQRRTKIMLG